MSERAEQKERRMGQILTIALDEFICKGFYGTSTREISRIAGVSSGLMFHYFKNKQALYERLIEIGCQKLEFDERTAYENPLEFFRESAGDMLLNLKSNPVFSKMFVFMNNAHYMQDISPYANELLRRHDVVSQSVPIMIRGQGLGQLKDGNPRALSIAFWCSLQGIAEAFAYSEDEPLPTIEWLIDIIRK